MANGKIPYNRQISGDEQKEARNILLPTIEACDAFGIARTNESKQGLTSDDSIGFLTGSQFRTNIFANDAKAIDKESVNNIEGLSDPSNANLKKNILDEVSLEFIGNAPTKVSQREENGLVLTSIDMKEKQDPYLTISVAPSDTDWMSFTHTHEWESGGGILQQILSTVSDFVQAGSDLITSFNNISSNVNGTNDFQAGRISRPDFTSTYKASSPTEFTIPFVLFTPGGRMQDFIRDIYYPIMLFNYLSYPKRLSMTKEEFDEERRENIENATGSATKESGGDNDLTSKYATQVTDTMNSLMPGMRYAILEPPSYVRVTHSSGLFRFPMCAITSFDYQYKAPWISMTKEEVKMPEYSAFTKDTTFLKRGFPCIADCKITLRSVDPLYADDWAQMFNISDVVKVSNSDSSLDSVQTARKRDRPIQGEENYESQNTNNRFGSGVRFASNIGVNIGFRGKL